VSANPTFQVGHQGMIFDHTFHATKHVKVKHNASYEEHSSMQYTHQSSVLAVSCGFVWAHTVVKVQDETPQLWIWPYEMLESKPQSTLPNVGFIPFCSMAGEISEC